MKYVVWIILAVVVYVLSSIFVFNYAGKAYHFDVERSEKGIERICGPLPWYIVCRPTYHDYYYDGNEWPFIVYWPLCWGYAKLVQSEL